MSAAFISWNIVIKPYTIFIVCCTFSAPIKKIPNLTYAQLRLGVFSLFLHDSAAIFAHSSSDWVKQHDGSKKNLNLSWSELCLCSDPIFVNGVYRLYIKNPFCRGNLRLKPKDLNTILKSVLWSLTWDQARNHMLSAALVICYLPNPPNLGLCRFSWVVLIFHFS